MTEPACGVASLDLAKRHLLADKGKRDFADPLPFALQEGGLASPDLKTALEEAHVLGRPATPELELELDAGRPFAQQENPPALLGAAPLPSASRAALSRGTETESQACRRAVVPHGVTTSPPGVGSATKYVARTRIDLDR